MVKSDVASCDLSEKRECTTTEKTVLLQEVGPRDGLQNESVVLSPPERVQLIGALEDAGVQRIQIGSFVNPRLVPQMAETDSVWRSLRKTGSTRYSVLVLNRRGLEQALSIGLPHVEIYVSASETHSKRNSGVTVARAIEDAIGMIEFALAAGATVTAGVMCAFGCFFEGEVPVERVGEIVEELNQPLPTEIGLADTTGMARPEGIRALIDRLSPVIIGPDRLTIHLHDTRGLGLANLEAALQLGVRRFDTSVGGLGGCPFIPGAAGNIGTEATVEFLHARGFSTGIDPEAVKAAKRFLELHLGRRFEPASTRNVP